MNFKIKPSWIAYWKAVFILTLYTLLSVFFIGVLNYIFTYKLSAFINGILGSTLFVYLSWKYIKAATRYNPRELKQLEIKLSFFLSMFLMVGGYVFSEAIDVYFSKSKVIETLSSKDIDDSRYYDIKNLQRDTFRCRKFVESSIKHDRYSDYIRVEAYLVYPINSISNAYYIRRYSEKYNKDSNIQDRLDAWLSERKRYNEKNPHKVVEVLDQSSREFRDFQELTSIRFASGDFLVIDTEKVSIPRGKDQLGICLFILLIMEISIFCIMCSKPCRRYLLEMSKH